MAEDRPPADLEAPMPRWVYIVGVLVILGALVFVAMHLGSGGIPSTGHRGERAPARFPRRGRADSRAGGLIRVDGRPDERDARLHEHDALHRRAPPDPRPHVLAAERDGGRRHAGPAPLAESQRRGPAHGTRTVRGAPARRGAHERLCLVTTLAH